MAILTQMFWYHKDHNIGHFSPKIAENSYHNIDVWFGETNFKKVCKQHLFIFLK
jgi:hypothetical protein